MTDGVSECGSEQAVEVVEVCLEPKWTFDPGVPGWWDDSELQMEFRSPNLFYAYHYLIGLGLKVPSIGKLRSCCIDNGKWWVDEVREDVLAHVFGMTGSSRTIPELNIVLTMTDIITIESFEGQVIPRSLDQRVREVISIASDAVHSVLTEESCFGCADL